MTALRAAYVVASDVRVAPEAADGLERAFDARLGAVDGWPGFQRLEVWRDESRDGAYVMVSWWDDETDFRAYMRSEQHRDSLARLPTGDERPRGAGLRRFTRIAG